MENYVVSALKYRPNSFETVVGQNSITTTLENAIQNNQLPQAMLFCGPRGVGKTTTAINLASYLSQAGKKVLMIDMDPQGNATSGLGVKAEAIQTTIYDLLCGRSTLSEVLYPTPFDNLHVIPSSQDLAGAEIELVSMDGRERALKNKIEPLRDYYDMIILDCPPSLGLLTVNALVASTSALVPVQCEYFALEGIAHLVETLTLVKEAFNPNLEILGIVLTMFDSRTSLNRQVVENTRRFFSDLVFDTVIPRNVRLSEAPSHGLPVALYSPECKGADAYYKLMEEVCMRV